MPRHPLNFARTCCIIPLAFPRSSFLPSLPPTQKSTYTKPTRRGKQIVFLSRWIDALSIKLVLIDEGVMTQYSDWNYVILPRVQRVYDHGIHATFPMPRQTKPGMLGEGRHCCSKSWSPFRCTVRALSGLFPPFGGGGGGRRTEHCVLHLVLGSVCFGSEET